MKRIFIWICLSAFLTSCGNRKVDINPFKGLTQLIDSVSDQVENETISKPSLVGKSRAPETDGLFDDFIFNYASDTSLQIQRTSFPLPYIHNGITQTIEKENWKHEDLFAEQSYYTTLFSKEEEMELAADTSLQTARLERISLKKNSIKQYEFHRTDNIWKLTSLKEYPIKQKEQDDFITFYAKFVSDSIYQRRHIASPLQFVTIDPDDEFSVLETTLDINQWYAFRSIMLTELLSNISYGESNHKNSKTKILKINGIGNGYFSIFYFRKKGKDWELYKYEDASI